MLVRMLMPISKYDLSVLCKESNDKYAQFMKQLEFSEKLLAVAEAVGLSGEQLEDLLTSGGDVPQQLMEVLENITDRTLEVVDDKTS